MRQYFDTSVIGTLVFRAGDWIALRQWLLQTGPSLIYSDFGIGELVSAVGRRVRMHQLGETEARKLLIDLPMLLHHWSCVAIDAADIALATSYMAHFELGLRLPDAIHIAVAQRLGLTLVSTDIRQVRAAATLGIAAINPLHTDGTHS
ncbi:type II toxin-antitoxin system VapC family toxin [Sphingomonas sp.]|uniref:type II toxin-antitoxin system VapC family toxin n=1 Tax=Sphingomonas sp. TaxID=28214 RepID=UPI00333F346C